MSGLAQRTVLENGIPVLSDRMEGVRSLSVGVLVAVGSRHESPAERGYAHLLEHMLFQGTDDRDARAIAEMMDISGGAMGAFTARDYTVYHATMLDEYLPFALEALGDMVCNSVLPQQALERQQSVILHELAGQEDAIKLANDLLKAALWPDHPLGCPIPGLPGTLQGATRDGLLDFMRRHYRASKLVLAAAGSVEHEHLVSHVRDAFWQVNGSGNGCLAGAAPPTARLGHVVAQPRESKQVYFALAWPAPPYVSPERYGWHVLAAMFGGGPTSRLFRALREERGLVYHIEAQYQAYAEAGALVVEGATLPETLVPVLAGILIELLLLGENEINLDDYHRTVQSLVSQHLVSGDSAYVRMSRLALQELYFQQAVTSEEVVAGLRSLSLETIRLTAQRVFAAGVPSMALVGPVSEPLLEAVGDMLCDFGGNPTLACAPRGLPDPATLVSEDAPTLPSAR